MTAYSTIDLKSEVEALIDNKSRIVALYQKGKCIKVNNALCQTYSRGYYISKEYDSSFLVEPIRDNLNITRVCKNRIEYLRQYEELKYHTLEHQIFNDVYKEKEWRIKYNRQIEILEKNGYSDLLDKKSVLELNKTDLKSFIKIYDENNSNINYVLNALKKGFKTIDEYLYSIRVKKLKKTFNFNNKEAKFFIKKYVRGFYYADFNMIFKDYKDVYILAKELGILKIGFPIALQDGLIQISFIVITIIANRRGLNDAAAVGIVEKVMSFLFLIPSSMLSTVSALGAQNIGAGKAERAKLTLRYAALIAVCFGTVTAITIQFIAEPVVALFTNAATQDGAETVRLGGQYLRGYVWDCIFAGIHFSFSGYFCACGKSIISFIHNIIAILLVRIPGVYLTSLLFPTTLFPMGLATAAGSLLSVMICAAAFIICSKVSVH